MQYAKRLINYLLPGAIVDALLYPYHYFFALVGAVIYGFPSRKLIVIGVTGTKGKTTVIELLSAIFEESGFKTAVSSTLHFKIGDSIERNILKMTMPGRGRLQKFLRDALSANCKVAIIEMTSEGARQFRHKFIELDALIFTNLAPEHIDSHGTLEKYIKAKISLTGSLGLSKNKKGVIISNADDEVGREFLNCSCKVKNPYYLEDAKNLYVDEKGCKFNVNGVNFESALPGIFNVYNILAAVYCASNFGIELESSAKAIQYFKGVRGRMEYVDCAQGFPVLVDYAHTPDSLEAVYKTLKEKKLICVLGSAGGGRDQWKRKVMGGIADKYCDYIFLTNEDPYDEDPINIINDVKTGIEKTEHDIILDRRKAISAALKHAYSMTQKVVVLITGKGTDPYIMGPNGEKLPWDDVSVAKQELMTILNK